MSRQLLNTAYLLLAGEVIAVTAIGFLVFAPTVREISKLRAESASLAEQLEERRQFLQSLDRKRVELEQKQGDEQLLAVALPADDDIDSVLRILHRAGQVAGATITAATDISDSKQRQAITALAQEGQQSVPTGVIPMGVETVLRGSYQQVRIFLEQIEKSARLMDVEAIELGRPANQPEPLQAKVTIQLYKLESVH